MKRSLIWAVLGILLISFALIALAGGAEVFGPPSPTEMAPEGREIVEIREKMFMTQINDIYINADDFLGKTIKYQGKYIEEAYEGMPRAYQYVYRDSPGCCGADGRAGFEIAWDQAKPRNNDWVEIVGTLERYEEIGMQFLRIQAASLTVLEERGMEFVTQ